jgi:hypothetical protein
VLHFITGMSGIFIFFHIITAESKECGICATIIPQACWWIDALGKRTTPNKGGGYFGANLLTKTITRREVGQHNDEYFIIVPTVCRALLFCSSLKNDFVP